MINGKKYFIYKEFDDEFGYREKIYITRTFETIEELFEYIEKRKIYWKECRTITIDIIKGVAKE